MSNEFISRRQFLTVATVGIVGAALSRRSRAEEASAIELGVCQSVQKSATIKQAGFQFIEGGVSQILMPRETDDAFAKRLKEIKSSALPVWSCNGFIPGELKIVGLNVKLDAVVAYAAVALRRAPKVGVVRIVLGSGKARQIPEGFSREKARDQFIEFGKRLGAVAHDNGVIVVLEPLNKVECNFINRVDEGAEIVDAVGHRGFQLHADVYHMMKENEGPESIIKAGKRIRHTHVATISRKPPGTEETDFRPYFKALQSIGYRDRMSIECGWKDREKELSSAYKVLRSQMSDVMS